MSGAPRRSLAPGVVLAGLLAIFALSVVAREDRFGTLEGRGHEWLTGSAVKFTRNWHREGAWALRFAMLENPRSIEFSTLRDREPYVSYPVGCLLPIYAVSTITRREPSPAMVMSVNLAGQLVGALAVFALVLVALESLELGFALRATLGALAFMLYVFLPGPFYWLQNVYFSDQAILPFVVIAILLEIVNDQAPRPGWMRLQSWVVGLGVFTDWFMVPVAAMLLVKKLVTSDADNGGLKARRVLLWSIPSVVALALFALQVASLGGLASLRQKLLIRTGLAAGTTVHISQLADRYWGTYVRANFGGALVPAMLILATLALLALALIRRRRDDVETRALWSGGLLLLPALLHTVVLWQHALDHSFSPLRLLPAVAVLPFALAPTLVARRLRWTGRARAALVVILIVVGTVSLLGGRDGMSGVERARRPEIPALGASLARLMSVGDVVFSPDFEVPTNPPELLSYSMKRVYRLSSPESLAARAAGLPTKARLRVVFLQEPDTSWTRAIAGKPWDDDGMVRAYDFGSAGDLARHASRAPRVPSSSARPAG